MDAAQMRSQSLNARVSFTSQCRPLRRHGCRILPICNILQEQLLKIGLHGAKAPPSVWLADSTVVTSTAGMLPEGWRTPAQKHRHLYGFASSTATAKGCLTQKHGNMYDFRPFRKPPSCRSKETVSFRGKGQEWYMAVFFLIICVLYCFARCACRETGNAPPLDAVKARRKTIHIVLFLHLNPVRT